MTSISKSIQRIVYISILGFVFFILPVNQAVAAVTYSWASNAAINYSNLYGGNGNNYLGRYVTDTITISGSTFGGGFSELNDINFIDLRLSSLNTNLPYYIWVCSTSGGGGCSNNEMIATSTSFTSNDVGSDYSWYRVYFDEPWSASFGIGQYLTFHIGTLVSDGQDNSISVRQYVDEVVTGYTSCKFGYGCFDGAPIRIGYDDGVGQIFVTDNGYSILDSETIRMRASFDLPKSVTDLYDDFILEWNYTIRAGAQVPEGYHSFDIDADTQPGEVSFSADYFCSQEIADFGSCFFSTTNISLTGILGNSTTPLMVLNNYALSLGASTTAEQLNDYLGSIDSTNYVYPVSGDVFTGLGYDSQACKIVRYNSLLDWDYTLDFTECVKYLFIPTTDVGVRLWAQATSTIFTVPPFSWGLHFFELFNTTASSSLPAVNLVVPTGLPGAGKSLSLAPWNTMKVFWDYTPSGTFITAATTSSIYELTKPIFNIVFYVVFGIWLIFIVINFRP